MFLRNITTASRMTIASFYLRFLSKEKQIKTSIKLADKVVKDIIQKESEWTGSHVTANAHLYWDGYKEMIDILYRTQQHKELKEAYDLLGQIMDSGQFNTFLFEISELIHQNHPRFMKYKYDLYHVMHHFELKQA